MREQGLWLNKDPVPAFLKLVFIEVAKEGVSILGWCKDSIS
jgi:hypothetical protein